MNGGIGVRQPLGGGTLTLLGRRILSGSGWESAKFLLNLDWDRWLQLFAVNEECLVMAGHQPALTMSLPFVHTARRCYRW